MRSLENFRIKFEIGNKDSSKGVIYTFLMAFINFQPNLLPAEKSDSKSFDQISGFSSEDIKNSQYGELGAD